MKALHKCWKTSTSSMPALHCWIGMAAAVRHQRIELMRPPALSFLSRRLHCYGFDVAKGRVRNLNDLKPTARSSEAMSSSV